LSGRARLFVGRFEEFVPGRRVPFVVVFNSWHWVESPIAVDLLAQLLEPGGTLALIGTEVVSWGQEPFERRLAEIFGYPWTKQMDHVDGSLQPVCQDPRFDAFRVVHHVCERRLDAETFVAVTKIYGCDRTAGQYRAIERCIDEEYGGAVTKVEDAAVYLTTRLAFGGLTTST
jgi:hypothetical protein